MRRSNVGLLFLLIVVTSIAGAQITSPMEIRDPGPQALQERYLPELKLASAGLEGHKYPYAFYFSHVLDIPEQQQKSLAQSGIRFEQYDGKTVLSITGNYYASYSAEMLDRSHRVRQTFNDVILPILKASVPQFTGKDGFSAFAVEVAQHVRKKVLRVSTEGYENVVMVLPRDAAERLVAAATPAQQQAAVLDAEVYLDGVPMVLWLTGDEPQVAPKLSAAKARELGIGHTASTPPVGLDPATADAPLVSPHLLGVSTLPVRVVTPDALSKLYLEHEDQISKMTRELNAQAHFVDYALPSFIAFRQNTYLQLPMATQLTTNSSSPYKVAALAFDQHIARMIRPVIGYWPDPDFDGIDFSSTVATADGQKSSVEFMLSVAALRCYARYDCTGQQLIDSGAVLINGERATIDLQKAEAQ